MTKYIDNLKIRGSYGSLGNQALNNGWYAYLSNYSTGQISWIMGSNQPQYVVPGARHARPSLGKPLHSGTWDLTSTS